MGGVFGSIIFVVWRESVEALLVIGILDAWLRNRGGTSTARRYLWGGVLAGFVVAGLLAAGLILVGSEISDDAQQMFQTAIVLVAAALIVQMVVWMRRHGRTMKRDLEDALSGAAARANWTGVALLAMVAVAREGSETVVFLYGLLSSGGAVDRLASIAAGLAGLAAAILTYGLLQAGSRILSWRVFFRLTETMLMFLAAALLVTGIDGLIDLGVLPSLGNRIWDTAWLVPDGGTWGGLFAALTGYRARPNLTEVIVYVAYWLAMVWLMHQSAAGRAKPA